MSASVRFLWLLSVGVLAIASSCKKNAAATDCPQLVQAPPAFLDYWYFPQGSQWVYRLRNSSPVVYDTVRVTLAEESHVTRGQAGDPRVACVQGYAVTLTHSNRIYFPGTGQPGTNPFGNEFLSSHPAFYREDWVLSQTDDIRTIYPLEVGFGYPIRVGQKLLNVLQFVDTVAVTTPAGTFRQSVHMVPDYGPRVDSTQFNWVRHVYRSRRIGITKIVYTNNQTWELIQFTINR